MLKIIPAESEEQLNSIRELFTEYTNSLGFDLSFQNYDKEFAELTGKPRPSLSTNRQNKLNQTKHAHKSVICNQNPEGRGKYTQPNGRLFLAIYNKNVAGCVGLRKFENDICEMKRLYVRPDFRRKGIGKALSVAIINAAREIGYSTMRLDTVPWMKEAITLYHSMGFIDILAYRYNPIPGTVYMELKLNKSCK